MKPYLVVSDLHGSLIAAQKIQELYATGKFKAILCCGDILYHGPRNDLPSDYAPKQVIAILNTMKQSIINVKGNCDGEVDQMVLQFPIENLTNTLYLQNRKVFMTHGHHLNPSSDLSFLNTGDIFLYGHVHLPYSYQNDQGIYILNPGSIALPKENHPKTYAILSETGFTICTLDDKEYQSVQFS